MKKFLVLLTPFLFIACATETQKIGLATVKITNLMSNSGGSGTVVASNDQYSEVLTNAHVCGVVRNGGLVHESVSQERHYVLSYRLSNYHDLCLIRVSGRIKYTSAVADFPPMLYETATVSGHPHLMPNMITQGHFSSKAIITVMTGFRECTPDDLKDPNAALFCLFIGKLPILKSYEAQAVSNTIQPGSSGSAVYDSDRKIASVIFAGEGDFGYGYAVPYEYVAFFLRREAKTLKPLMPNNEIAVSSQAASKRELLKKIHDLCDGLTDNKVCDTFRAVKQTDSLIYKE